MTTRAQPVKVTAWLSSPLAGSPPYLDSLLEWVMSFHLPSIESSSNGARHRVSRRPRGTYILREDIGKIPLPIRRERFGGLPIPRCSAPILGDVLNDKHDRISKTLIHSCTDLCFEDRVLAQGGGEYKSYHLPLRVRLVDRVVWFAEGDPRRIKQRCRAVPAIGKKVSIGYGRVAEWQVERIEEPLSWYAQTESGTVLMRVLPLCDQLPAELIGYREWYGGCCPPYWQADLYRKCVQPC